jgi:hypothetical protein
MAGIGHRHRPVVLVASPGASLPTARRGASSWTGGAPWQLACFCDIRVSSVNPRQHPKKGVRQQPVRASRSWCAYSRPNLRLWMLGLPVKMLSCPVLQPFAVFSSRRSQYRSQSSREPKKLDRRLSTWLLRSWTGFLIHLLLMKSGKAENGGSLKGRKNFEICAMLSARDRRAKSKGDSRGVSSQLRVVRTDHYDPIGTTQGRPRHDLWTKLRQFA